MKKLFEKNEILFAIIWIVIYVVGYSVAESCSDTLLINKIATTIYGLVLSGLILLFIKKNKLMEYFGICKVQGELKQFLFFIPLVILMSVNLWFGVTLNCSAAETFFYVISMCGVGFLEEIIFRGFLFRAMCKNSVVGAVIVSSLTFGVGHIVNLLNGAPVFDTINQIVYASAIGFVFTVIVYIGKSVVPCILAHAVIDVLSVFAVDPDKKTYVVVTIAITVMCVAYGIYLLMVSRKKSGIQTFV